MQVNQILNILSSPVMQINNVSIQKDEEEMVQHNGAVVSTTSSLQ